MRIPEPRSTPSLIPQLGMVIEAGLTTTLAIAITSGVSEDEARRLLSGEIEPTDEQRNRLETLFVEYSRAIAVVNAKSLKARL